jgi:hypothetical protein
MYVTGEFRDRAAVVAAIRSLRAGGIDPDDLDLFSQEPLELPKGVLDRPSRMSLFSVIGAITFGAVATAFIRYTQHDYRLVTGGMPLFSFWATGVITYEMTMLGAIGATLTWFLRESGLGARRDRRAPVPMLDPGSVCLRVRCRADQAWQAGENMRIAGAIQIERGGDA